MHERNNSCDYVTNGCECFHCGSKSVIWDGDFSFEDYGMDGEGIIHECHCTYCGARITYEIPCEEHPMTIEEACAMHRE